MWYKRVNKHLGVVGIVGVIVISACAQTHMYDPFEKTERVRFCSVKECEEVSEEYVYGENYQKIYKAPGEDLAVKIEAAGKEVYVSILKGGEGLTEPVLIIAGRALSHPMFYWRAFAGDLNNDGRTDFVVPVWQGGMGLGVGTSVVAFLLSEEETYRVVTINDSSPNQKRFVDLGYDGRCYYVQCAVVYANHVESIVDGQRRNFFVYNLLGFDGSGMEVRNDADDTFPRWVRIGDAQESRNIQHFTEETKKDLLGGDLLDRRGIIFREQAQKSIGVGYEEETQE